MKCRLMCLFERVVVSNCEGQQGLLKKVREAESIGIYSALNKVSVSETKRIEDRNILWVNNHTKTHRKISSAPADKQEFTEKDTHSLNSCRSSVLAGEKRGQRWLHSSVRREFNRLIELWLEITDGSLKRREEKRNYKHSLEMESGPLFIIWKMV